MPTLQVFVTSTRPTRIGLAVAEWFVEKAKTHGKFSVELIDLKEVNLPPLDEPQHPIKRQYEHAHTKAWSESVARADAYVFCLPEYNYAMPPALVNAIDYLHFEWQYKPVGYVSYGGVSGGTRAVQMSKLLVTSLKMMPLPEAVTIPFVQKSMKDGKLDPGDTQDEPATKMLHELLRWANALKSLRS